MLFKYMYLYLFGSHKYFGYYVEHFRMTAATARGAMSYLLHILECGKYAIEGFMGMKRVCYINVAYLLAIAYHIVFFHC